MKGAWIRRVAVGMGVIVLVLLVGAGALIATFDANRYKAFAVDWMKSEHQRALAIDGPIKLSVFPRLEVETSKVRLSERGRSDPFIAADEVALAVQVLPLLRKQLVIDRVRARGVRATYSRAATGVRNIDDLVSGNGAATVASGTALRFDVNALQLNDLRILLRDETVNVAGEVAVLSFSAGRLAHRVSSPASLRATVQLMQPRALNLALDGSMTIALDLERSTIAVSGLKLDVQGAAAGVTALSLMLEGALAWDGSTLRAEPLRMALKGGTLGTLSLAPSALVVERALVGPGGQRFELDALKIEIAGRQGIHPFELSLDWPRLTFDAGSLGGSAFEGHFKVAGPVALGGNFQSAAPSGSFDALRLPGVAVTIGGSAGQRRFDGSAKADVLWDVGRREAAFEPLDLNATVVDPGLQPLRIVIRGKVGANVTAVQWALAGTLDAGRFESTGHASLAGAVPRVEADARFDRLDLNRLLAPDKPVSTTAMPADTPLQFEGLGAIDGRFTFAAGALAFRQYRVADLKMRAALDHGALHVSRLACRAWGGTIEASGSADARGRRVAAKLAVSDVDASALLETVVGKSLIEGTGRAVADVDSSGASVGALRKQLAGSVAVKVRNGAIKGIDLERTMRQVKLAVSRKQVPVIETGAKAKTHFEALTASARIAGGVAHSDDLDARTPLLRIGGAGRVDIGQGRIDYTARATVLTSAAGQDGAELAALRGVTVPVVLSGPFDAIDWKIQWSDLAAAAVESRLRDRIAKELGIEPGTVPPAVGGAASTPARPEDKLLQQLKRLFK